MRIRLTAAAVATLAALVLVAAAPGEAPPVGALPPGPTTVITTAPGELVGLALPRRSEASGLVWRIARPFDARVAVEVSEADVGNAVVLVLRARRRGTTTVRLGLTRGETPRAVASRTFRIVVR